MTGIVHRVGGAQLTNAQLDANFDYLDSGITLVGNVAYNILATDKTVISTATFTADRIWRLPTAASVSAGRSIVVIDAAGGTSASFRIYVRVQTGENFNGQTNNYITISIPYDRCIFTSDGVSNWSGGVHINGQGQSAIQDALGLHELAWRDDNEVFLLGANNAGDLYMTGDGRLIGGDLSNAVHSKRLHVQTTTPDGNTSLGVIPNGTSTGVNYRLYSNSNPDAGQVSAYFGQAGDDTVVRSLNINSGTGTARIHLQVESTDLVLLDGTGAKLGVASLTTTATTGFPYIPSCAGTPTGTPTAVTGMVPQVWDHTNKKLYVYDGAWIAMN